MRMRLSVERRLRRGLGAWGVSPNPPTATAIVTRPSSGAPGPRPAPPLSVPATYGAAIAPPLPARVRCGCRGCDCVGVVWAGVAVNATRAAIGLCHERGGLSVPIVPDGKDWTWVLERPCPECGFDAGRCCPNPWQGCCAPTRRRGSPFCSSRATWCGDVPSRTVGRRWSTPATCATSARCTTSGSTSCCARTTRSTRTGTRTRRRSSSGTASRTRPWWRSSCAGPPRHWPRLSTECGVSNGAVRVGAATAPASASRASAATCCTTQSTIFTTSPGIGGG